MRRLLALMCLAAPVWAQSAEEKLHAHTQEFRQEVIEVVDGVHVAIGFGLANSILIEGEDGVIIVDVMEGPATARAVREAFDAITDKPVKALIYTHFHADHIAGGKVLAGGADVDVYAHVLTQSLVEKSYGQLRPIIAARSLRQFGIGVPQDLFLNCGIGPFLRPSLNMADNYLPPTRTFASGRVAHEVAGIRFEIVHAPGETDDQLYVWLPDKKVLLPGDNYYKAFPNLYAIRGTSYRDVRKWADSLDQIIAEEPEYLIPSHTRPLVGADTIRETLTNYRDAIRFVHDETVKGMNAGQTPDELVQSVTLPERLAELPYLQEFYGTVEWSVRSIFNGYLGWFDGNPTNLSPLSPIARARQIAELAGGADELLGHAEQALSTGEYQWAAELADHLVALNHRSEAARTIKANALLELGKRHPSANGRNYYLTTSGQLSP